MKPLKPPRMVLVGLGVDDTTERMVGYMASGGMDISLLTFYGFVNTDGKTLLTRNVEVDSDRIAVNQGPRSRHRNRRAQFESKVQTLPEDMRSVLDAADRMFRSQSVRIPYRTFYSTNKLQLRFFRGVRNTVGAMEQGRNAEWCCLLKLLRAKVV